MNRRKERVTTFVDNDYFTVDKWDIKGHKSVEQTQPFLLCSVIEGNGTLERDEKESILKKGDHFLLPADFGTFSLNGEMKLIVSHV